MADLKLSIIINAITDGARQGLRQTQTLIDELGRSGQAAATHLYSVFALLWAQMTGIGVDALGHLGNAFQSNSFFQQAEPALNRIKAAFFAFAQAAAAVKHEITDSLKTFAKSLAAETVIEWRGVKFEANFADVKKVVSGSVDSIKNLRKELLDMAAEIAMPMDGLAKMQAIAGQLGFPVDQIDAFVKLVSKGAVAFELLPEQAAAAFGNLKNIYDLNLQELEFLGDQINYIADKANTNEAALLDVMNRAGGAAQRFGLLRGETVALASAMLSMGKPPELVGTAMDMLLSRLQNAKNQSKDFQEGLQLLGTDAKTLADNIDKNPKKALDGLLASLSKLTPASQTDILSRLIGEAGEAKGVIGDLVGKLGEYQRLTELSKASDIAGSMDATFQERQKTVQAALVMMKNAWDGLAISASTMFLPTIRAVVDGFRDLAVWLRRVNEEYPNLMGFARIALIFGTLGNVFSLVFNRITAWVAGMGASLAAELVGPLSRLPVLAAWLLSSFWGRLVAGAVLITVGFNGLLAAVTALASGFTTLISHPVSLFLAGLAFVTARIALASSLFAGLGVAVSGFGATLLRLVGGPIGLAVSAIAFLIVKYNEIKDEQIQFGDSTVKVSEIIQAAWTIVVGAFDQAGKDIRFVLGFLTEFLGGNLRKMGQDLIAAAELPKNLANSVIGVFNGLGKAVGESLARFVEDIQTRFRQAVSLAQAAGRDIKAAFSGDFGSRHWLDQVSANTAEDTDIERRRQSEPSFMDTFVSGYMDAYQGHNKGGFVTDLGELLGEDFALGTAQLTEQATLAVNHYAAGAINTLEQTIQQNRIAAFNAKNKNDANADNLEHNKGESNNHARGVDLPDIGDGGSSGKVDKRASAEKQSRAEIDTLEQSLAARKLAFEKTNLLLEFGKKEEKAYWDEVIANFKGSSVTLSHLKQKSAQLDVEILRESAREQQAVQAEFSQMQQTAALSDLDFKRQMADQELELGRITQAEHLERLKELAAEELALRLKILEDRRKLHLNDPVEQAKITTEQQQVMIEFRGKWDGLDLSALKDAKNDIQTLFAPLQNALDQSINGILTGQQTIANAARNAAQSVVLSYLQQSVRIRMIKVQDWLFEHTGMAKLLNDKKQFDLLETVWDAAMWARKRVRQSLQWAWEITGLAGVEARKRAVKQASALWDDVLGKKGLAMQAVNWLAEVTGFGAKETTKAAVKIGSEAIQTGATATGTAARGAIEDTANAKSSLKMAWQAAKGAFSWVMKMVPFPFNIVLAPIVGAAAFAGTMALGSSKGGEYYVDGDDKPYLLHKKESVLPAGVADNFRQVVDYVQTGGLSGQRKTLDQSTALATINAMVDNGSLRPMALPNNIVRFADASNERAAALAQTARQYDRQVIQQVVAAQPAVSPAPAPPPARRRDELHIHTVSAEELFSKNSRVIVKQLAKEARRFNKGTS